LKDAEWSKGNKSRAFSQKQVLFSQTKSVVNGRTSFSQVMQIIEAGNSENSMMSARGSAWQQAMMSPLMKKADVYMHVLVPISGTDRLKIMKQ
jgi:hypothetical protein